MKSIIILMLVAVLFTVPVFGQGDEWDNAFQDEYGNSYDADLDYLIDEDDPGTGFEGGGSVEGPEAPIDDYIPVFLLIAIGTGYYFNKRPSVTKEG